MRISDWSSDVCSSDLRLAKMEAGTKHKAHIEKKNGRAPRDARPIPSVLGDAGDELQQGAARILVDPPLTLGFFRGDAEFDDLVVTIIDSMHDNFPFQRCDRNKIGRASCRERVCHLG